MLENKLKLIVNEGNCPEELFNDIKELYALSQCQNAEPVSVGQHEIHIKTKYNLSDSCIEKNLGLYQTWLDNQPKCPKSSRKLSSDLSHDGLDCYLF